VATVTKNTADCVEFQNFAPSDAPTLLVSAGDWQTNSGGHETGLVFDVFGAQAPILSPDDARKLARWLERAAAFLDGKKPEKKHKQKYRSDDDEDYDDWRG
jgi:hypothetical protein